MLCPACREDMAIVELHRVELDLCLTCRGVWLDSEELAMLFLAAGHPEHGAQLEQRLAALPARRADRRCPRCDRKLDEVDVGVGSGEPVAIDLCPEGDGLWFDEGELPHLFAGSLPEDGAGLREVRDFLGQFARVKEG